MNGLLDRFRLWFEHECDCNAKILTMLESVPMNKRQDPAFAKALEKAAHIALARELWLSRLSQDCLPPTNLFPALPLKELRPLYESMQAKWVKYFAGLSEADLQNHFEYVRQGVSLRYTVEFALTQLNGHAWYHRGQVGSIVAQLGGEFVDTDFVFWQKPSRLLETDF